MNLTLRSSSPRPGRPSAVSCPGGSPATAANWPQWRRRRTSVGDAGDVPDPILSLGKRRLVREASWPGQQHAAAATTAKLICRLNNQSTLELPINDEWQRARLELNVQVSTEQILAGICAGSVNAFVMSPFDVVKSRIQVQNTVLLPSMRYTGVWDSLRHIIRSEGARGLWRGYSASAVAVPVFWSTSFTLYEGAKAFFRGWRRIAARYPQKRNSSVYVCHVCSHLQCHTDESSLGCAYPVADDASSPCCWRCSRQTALPRRARRPCNNCAYRGYSRPLQGPSRELDWGCSCRRAITAL